VTNFAADDANGTDDGGGIGENAVAGTGQVVPAAGRHVADADDDGLVLGDAANGLPHGFAGQGAAAGGVDADGRLL